MKKVLSLLAAFVFVQAQTWALSGGPVFRSPSSANIAGLYAGTLIPNGTSGTGTGPNNNLSSSGQIGVFSTTIPVTGVSTGSVALFVNGQIYIGTLNAIADPDQRRFTGLIDGTGTLFFNNSIGSIQGQIQARIIESSSTPLSGRGNLSLGNSARLRGSAVVDMFTNVNVSGSPQTIIKARFTVDGFRQRTTALPSN